MSPEPARHSLEDREVLRSQAYADANKLRARQALWSYIDQPRRTSRVSWACPLEGTERIVDVGCGHGADLKALRQEGHRGPMVGVDFSFGMLSEVPSELAARVLGDALALPLADASADVVLAMHMLYHVGDMAGALREFQRVMTPSGAFLASANSSRTASELREPWSEAMVAVGGPPIKGAEGRFTVETGAEILEAVFDVVELKESVGVSRIPEARIVRDYVASTDDLYEPLMPEPAAWQEVLDRVSAHAQAVIDRDGHFAVTSRGGVFVCKTTF